MAVKTLTSHRVIELIINLDFVWFELMEKVFERKNYIYKLI